MPILSLIYILWKSLGGFLLTSLSSGVELNINNIKSNPVMGIQVPILQRFITMHYFAFIRVLVENRVNFIGVHLGTKVKIFWLQCSCLHLSITFTVGIINQQPTSFYWLIAGEQPAKGAKEENFFLCWFVR